MCKCLKVLLLSAAIVALVSASAWANKVSLYETVEKALQYSPRLKELQFNRDAVQHDLDQSRGAYLPSVDLILGYGLDQHSDSTTRLDGADPSNEEWDRRGEASLSLTQKLYDGGETKSRVEVRKSLIGSADHRVHDNAQAIALDAIIAHLDVYRQRELVSLSEMNLKMHQDILGSLQELREAGAGSVADVTQVQGRLARAESSLYATKADLSSANGRYLRIVGMYPQDVGYAGMPIDSPVSLEQALQETEHGNPKVLALGKDTEEATARIDLAESAYKPKINLELKTNYRDQVEGDSSWKYSNEAMVRLRWNLFNGGQDKAGANAAKSRKMQSRSSMMEQLTEALEETNTSWAQLFSSQKQVVAYRSAVDFSKETLESYMQQFNVAQRSLLDVLDAQNEYYQTGGQLVTSAVNRTVASYRLLALSGRLKVSEGTSADNQTPDYLIGLGAPVVLGGDVSALLVEDTQDFDAELSVISFLQSWVYSWETQDLSSYLNFYSPNYSPERGRTYEEWRNFRTKRLSQPEAIVITLNAIEVSASDDGHYQVTFSQDYMSNLYQDQVQKTLVLESASGGWQILREMATPPNS